MNLCCIAINDGANRIRNKKISYRQFIDKNELTTFELLFAKTSCITMFFTRFLAIIIILSIVCTAMTCSSKTTGSRSAFFDSVQYKGNFFTTLPLMSPDSTVKRIKDEVPSPWEGIACERAYYYMNEHISDSVSLRYLDLCEQNFRHDSIWVFTQALRGKIFLHQNKYDTARACFESSYALATKLHSTHRTGDAKYMMSGLYSRQGNYPEAAKTLQEAYDAFSESPESLRNGQLFETMLSFGNVYRNAEDYISAQMWNQRAWLLASTNDWVEGYKITTAAAVANNYLHLNQLDSAKIMIDTAFYFQKLYKNDYDAANRYYILGQMQTAQGDCTAAVANLWQAKQTNTRTNDAVVIHRYNEKLAAAYTCLGRLDSAVWFYQQALATPDTADQARVYAQLSKIYAQNGDYAQAYSARQNSQRLSDKVFTTEKDKAIGRLQAQNDLANSRRALAEEAHQIKTNRLIIITFLSLLSMGLVIATTWGYRKKQESRLAQQSEQLAEQQKDLIQQEKELIEQENELIRQEKELAETRELLKAQALTQVKKDLAIKNAALEQAGKELEIKETALEETQNLLDLKNLMIQTLEMQLTVKNEETRSSLSPSNRDTPSVSDTPLQNLKILTAEDWRTFRQLFDSRFPTFGTNLTTRFPKLTAAETRLLLLIKIGFDAFEIANILGITSASVYTSCYRLRKKLGVDEDGDLERFVVGL
jgi:tetratricopeptide (TPR) repeat protein